MSWNCNFCGDFNCQGECPGAKSPCFVNLTPHAIAVRKPDGSEVTFPPSGTVARVEQTTWTAPAISGVTIRGTRFGKITGLEKFGPNDNLIVSGMVRSALPEAKGLFSPDTGATAIRNENGHIVAVTGFLRN